MYDPEHNNSDQLHSLIDKIKSRSALLEQQKIDIDEMLQGLREVRNICENAIQDSQGNNPTLRKRV